MFFRIFSLALFLFFIASVGTASKERSFTVTFHNQAGCTLYVFFLRHQHALPSTHRPAGKLSSGSGLRLKTFEGHQFYASFNDTPWPTPAFRSPILQLNGAYQQAVFVFGAAGVNSLFGITIAAHRLSFRGLELVQYPLLHYKVVHNSPSHNFTADWLRSVSVALPDVQKLNTCHAWPVVERVPLIHDYARLMLRAIDKALDVLDDSAGHIPADIPFSVHRNLDFSTSLSLLNRSIALSRHDQSVISSTVDALLMSALLHFVVGELTQADLMLSDALRLSHNNTCGRLLQSYLREANQSTDAKDHFTHVASLEHSWCVADMFHVSSHAYGRNTSPLTQYLPVVAVLLATQWLQAHQQTHVEREVTPVCYTGRPSIPHFPAHSTLVISPFLTIWQPSVLLDVQEESFDMKNVRSGREVEDSGKKTLACGGSVGASSSVPPHHSSAAFRSLKLTQILQGWYLAREWVILRQAVSPVVVRLMREYYRDGIVHDRFRSVSHDKVMHFTGVSTDRVGFLWAQLIARYLSSIIGRPVKALYSFLAFYHDPASRVTQPYFRANTARADNEYTVHLQLDLSCRSVQLHWPLYLHRSYTLPPRSGWQKEPPLAECDEILLNDGDVVLFRPRYHVQFRRPLPAGCEATVLFAHFVDETFDVNYYKTVLQKEVPGM